MSSTAFVLTHYPSNLCLLPFFYLTTTTTILHPLTVSSNHLTTLPLTLSHSSTSPLLRLTPHLNPFTTSQFFLSFLSPSLPPHPALVVSMIPLPDSPVTLLPPFVTSLFTNPQFPLRKCSPSHFHPSFPEPSAILSLSSTIYHWVYLSSFPVFSISMIITHTASSLVSLPFSFVSFQETPFFPQDELFPVSCTSNEQIFHCNSSSLPPTSTDCRVNNLLHYILFNCSLCSLLPPFLPSVPSPWRSYPSVWRSTLVT